ncbi:hypothetical protein V495_07938, partial [Pseudogymnoascus sp. VKM F-4514 (FW-929)]
ATTTTSPEALRTLALLATHYSTLSYLLAAPTPPTLTDADLSTASEQPLSTSAAVAELRAKPPSSSAAQEAQQHHPLQLCCTTAFASSSALLLLHYMPLHKLSSSIASNHASARSICTTALSSLTPAYTPGAISTLCRYNLPAAAGSS